MSNLSSETPVTSVAIYICTYKRNKPLVRLLESLEKAAKKTQHLARVGVVIVDDNTDGRAEPIAEQFKGRFDLDIHYRHSGAQNISKARNMGIEACLELADWVGMLDDDQVVVETWLQELLTVQNKTSADAVTGPVHLTYPEGSPSWLTDEPFAEILEAPLQENANQVSVCSTGNSMLRSSFLRENPEVRFREDLGEVGGEDMVFYKQATDAGLRAFYARKAVSYGEEPPERSTFKHHLRRSYWMGNSEYITNKNSNSATNGRMFLRGTKRIFSAGARCISRAKDKENIQWRFAAARIMQSVGIYAGILGIKVKHK